jgi:hypothetical protein
MRQDIIAAGYYFLGIPFEMSALAEQRYGHITSIESHLYYFGALGYENALRGLYTVSKLCFS